MTHEGQIHRKYKQSEPVGCYKQMSAIKEGAIMRLQVLLKSGLLFSSKF